VRFCPPTKCRYIQTTLFGTVLQETVQWRRKHIMTGPGGRGRATTCELYAKIIAESELLQPALNEIHKFCFQHWSGGRGTCGTGVTGNSIARKYYRGVHIS